MSYSSGYFTTRETWRDWRIEAAHLMRLAHVRRGSLVLEIGCGAGGLLRLLGARGARAVGIDPLALGLELARHRVRHAQLVRVAAGPELPFQADTLDAILGQHVLEHISDVNTAMQEWRRVLKPGGWLALATPNADYPDPAHFADEDHDHVFSPQELRSAAEQAGLAVECCYTIFPYLSRRRWLRGFGVVGHQLFRRVPYFAQRGRTVLLSAMKPPTKPWPSLEASTERSAVHAGP
ncbi:MAG: class I SAM-dependent methyltransferase [Chloroflexi bacterium]|nr:class I SAM-dependent methyltransferase [Chloroflexota bacterium]